MSLREDCCNPLGRTGHMATANYKRDWEMQPIYVARRQRK